MIQVLRLNSSSAFENDHNMIGNEVSTYEMSINSNKFQMHMDNQTLQQKMQHMNLS